MKENTQISRKHLTFSENNLANRSMRRLKHGNAKVVQSALDKLFAIGIVDISRSLAEIHPFGKDLADDIDEIFDLTTLLSKKS